MIQVEQLISGLPSLNVFDEFALKACGFYCKVSCYRGLGFASVILDQWGFCLSRSSSGSFQPPNEKSTQFVMVSNLRYRLNRVYSNKVNSITQLIQICLFFLQNFRIGTMITRKPVGFMQSCCADDVRTTYVILQ